MRAEDCKVGLTVKCISGYNKGRVGTIIEPVLDAYKMILGWRIDFGSCNLPWYTNHSIPNYLELMNVSSVATTKPVNTKPISSVEQQDLNSFQKLYDFFASVASGNCKCNTPKDKCPYHRE